MGELWLGGPKTRLRMKGKESSGNVFTRRRGFRVWSIRVVVPLKRGSRGGRRTEKGFPDRGRDDIDVGIFSVEGS